MTLPYCSQAGFLRLFLLAAVSVPVSAQGIITTVAGTDSVFPVESLPALTTPLGPVSGVAADASGQVFLSLPNANVVLRLSKDGSLALYAGNGGRGFAGDNGQAVRAMLNQPTALEVDSSGALYIADLGNLRVRKVSPQGVITSVAGGGKSFPNGVAATQADVNYLTDIALDAAGNLFITGAWGRVLKVTPGGIITSVAGGGAETGDGVSATKAAANPSSVAVDASGNFFFSETSQNRVRKVSTAGILSTAAGNGKCGEPGDGGTALSASVCTPLFVETDAAGNLFIVESTTHRIRKVDAKGTISTVAGTGQAGFSGDGKLATGARLFWSKQVSFDQSGSLYIADEQNHRLRVVDADGIIRTLAGNGARYRFGGDDGPARSALLSTPLGLVVDPEGNIFIADQSNACVRKVSPDGTIRTIAGNPRGKYPGDGGPATEAMLDRPTGLALDAAGNLFIADGPHVHKVTPAGIISTLAGNSQAASPGDGGPALKAALRFASGVAVDSAGNIYVGEGEGHRVRKITPDGIINTIAGTGTAGYSGDNRPGTQAMLSRPWGVAVDAAGYVYVADANNRRIRRISPGGEITTVAGKGIEAFRFTGEGGLATEATLHFPNGVSVDQAGVLYIADTGSHGIRKVGRDGKITTVAGSGDRGFRGDGGPARAAWLDMPYGVTTDRAGNLFVADSYNDRVRVVSASAPTFSISTDSIAQTVVGGGSAASAGVVNLVPSIPGLPFTARATTRDGGGWLSVDPADGNMPVSLNLAVNPGRLALGTYEGTVAVTCPLALPAVRNVAVKLTVTASRPAQLALETRSLSFSFGRSAGASSAQLSVSNVGSGSLSFTAAATSGGGNWLGVTPASGSSTPSAPAALSVTANPGTLGPGTYSGFITVTPAGGQPLTVVVTMSITDRKPRILLSQTGLAFRAVAGGGAPALQSFGILNSGEGAMSWSAKASTLAGGDWLTLGGASGAVETPLLDVSMVDASVNHAGLKPGTYYGRIEIASAAGNSPQSLTVMLRVLPEGDNPGPEVRPVGLIFIGTEGRGSPGSQDVRLTNLQNKPASYISSRATFGGEWVSHRPVSASVAPGAPGRVVIQPDFTSLAPGVYRGAITLLFDDNTPPQNVELLTVLASRTATTNGSKSRERNADSCVLNVQFTELSNDFTVRRGEPVTIGVKANDCAGRPVAPGSGKSVVMLARFSNRDPETGMTHIGNGEWRTTWRPTNASTDRMQVEITALLLEGSNRSGGQASRAGRVLSDSTTPLVPRGALLNAASYQVGGALAPGSLVALFGVNLTDTNSVNSFPLPFTLGATEVRLAGRPLPLVATSSTAGQINAQLPYDLPVNETLQLEVQRGGELSVPEPVVVASAQPGVFTENQSGSGQGIIVKSDQLTLARTGTPAGRGEYIVIYCTGLGAVTPPVQLGQPAPVPAATTTVPVSVTIGGKPAEVLFSGLTPGFAGLYQVNAKVPADAPAGDAVEVILEVSGQKSRPVTMAVR